MTCFVETEKLVSLPTARQQTLMMAHIAEVDELL